MQLIVTGFEKFAEFTYNPSQLAVEALPEMLTLANGESAVPIIRLVLSACCERAWDALVPVLTRQPGTPTVVILTGLASRRDRINLERFALNIKDYRIPDNDGHQPEDEPIDSSGPEAIRTKLPLPSMASRLNDLDYLCMVSNHAGTFLCNEIYYRCLRTLELSGSPSTALFVHLPLPESYLSAQKPIEEIPAEFELTDSERRQIIDTYSSALQEIGAFACEWLSERCASPSSH